MRLYTNLFESILEKPELMIGDRSITKMVSFLRGFQMAKGQEFTTDELYMGFQGWIESRYRMSASHNWASIILFMEGGSEYRAFERVKKLWYTYKSETESLC